MVPIFYAIYINILLNWGEVRIGKILVESFISLEVYFQNKNKTIIFPLRTE